MLRRARVLLATAIATFAAIASAGSAAGAPHGTVVIKLVSVTTSDSLVDKPPKGTSPGDAETSSSRLLNAVAQFGKPKGAAVGKDQGTIRVVAGANPVARITARLPGGTLQLSGHIEAQSDGTIVIPVVSGAGRFIGAKGWLVITPLKAKGQALNEYRLNLSSVI